MSSTEAKKTGKKDEKKDIIYTIPLKRIYWGRRRNRADRAIRLIRKFVARHFHVDQVIIDPSVNEYIWSRGREKPPRRITIRVIRVSESTAKVLLASPVK